MLLELLKNRRATHHFLPDNRISDETFLSLLEGVRYTPSGYNAQPWLLYLFREKKDLEMLTNIALEQPQIKEAGNAVLVLGNAEFGNDEWERILKEWKEVRKFSAEKIESLKASLQRERPTEKEKSMALRNASLAAMNFLLCAEDAGWNTCPMMGYSQLGMKQWLGLEEKWVQVMLIALGKADPKKTEAPFPRKKSAELVKFW